MQHTRRAMEAMPLASSSLLPLKVPLETLLTKNENNSHREEDSRVWVSQAVNEEREGLQR